MATVREFRECSQRRTKRNFVKENMRQLKQIQRHWEEQNRAKAERLPRPLVKRVGGKANGGGAVGGSKVQVMMPAYSDASDDGKVSTVTPPTVVADPIEVVKEIAPIANTKSQGCQTVEASEVEKSGVVKYPRGESWCSWMSASDARETRDMGLQAGGDQADQPTIPATVLSQAIKGTGVDFVRLNAMVQYKEKVPKKHKNDPLRPPPFYQKGVLPKYLRDAKREESQSEMSEKEDNYKLEEKDPECPPGHVLMPDSERKQHLALIQQNYSDLVSELNNLPVQTDSLKVRQRKMNIERELDKMEFALKIFSRQKLFIKISS